MNIAERLKDAPKGTKLYSPLFGEVELQAVNMNSRYPISVKCQNGIEIFTNEGKYTCVFKDSDCLLFPSKENRNWDEFKVKVDSQFPTTYEKCCDVLGCDPQLNDVSGWHSYLIRRLQQLLICCRAWWDVDNDWEPDYSTSDIKYCIGVVNNKVCQNCVTRDTNCILVFRTLEIRNKFLETFKDLIEDCKELL